MEMIKKERIEEDRLRLKNLILESDFLNFVNHVNVFNFGLLFLNEEFIVFVCLFLFYILLIMSFNKKIIYNLLSNIRRVYYIFVFLFSLNVIVARYARPLVFFICMKIKSRLLNESLLVYVKVFRCIIEEYVKLFVGMIASLIYI
jgi:hypothetical protein